ncbi:MAG: iron ABC transporter permease [Armatimonadota bacterium]|nr:iron ABC transporter permease [Armatimonadota bacterium]MDR7533487.1 iron ABC transporter permease [Armatimonadota bacterium]MDR7537012.1 iron ABC transporter permease [Armatimonadota bacterium]
MLRRTGWPRAALRSGVAAAAAALGAVVLVLVLYPSAVLVLQSFVADGRLSLAHYARLARDGAAHRVLANSLVTSAWATVGGTALGTALAWLVVRTDLPGRALWRTLLLLPYMIPPFIGAIAWVYLAGPVGYLNQAWRALTGAEGPLLVIYGQAGIVLVLILYGYPIAYLAALGVLERMDPSLEAAARLAGAGPWRVLRDVTLPLALPGVLAGALLLCMSSLANFGIPAVLGFPARYFVLPTRIYTTILNFDLRDNLRIAAALSMWLVAVATVLLVLQRAALRRGRFTVVGGQAAQRHLVALGRWRAPVAALLGVFVLASAGLPFLAVLLTSLIRAYGLPPHWENLTLQHYATALFGIPKVHRALLNSLALAAGGATLVVAMGAAIGYLRTRARLPGASAVDLLVMLPYAIPGTVVALAMILAWVRPVPLLGIRLYDTIWILLVAYVARFLAFGVRTVTAGLAQVHESLEEAARCSGARPLEAFRDVVLPVIRPSLVAGWLLAFIPAVAELTLSILLFSVGNETLGVVIFGLHDEGKIALSAALAVLVTTLLVAFNLLARRVLRGEVGL